jgi:nucleotide-binding universal stress UspA family protein
MVAAASNEHFRGTLYAVIVRSSKDPAPLLDHSMAPVRHWVKDWDERKKRIYYVVDKAAAEAKVQLQKEIIYGEVDEALLRFAEQHECDVIVIGSTGRGRLVRALRGSISHKVALNARCSVYIVR